MINWKTLNTVGLVPKDSPFLVITNYSAFPEIFYWSSEQEVFLRLDRGLLNEVQR